MSFDPLTAALDFGGKVLDRVIADPDARAAAQFKLRELEQTGELATLTAETDLAKAQIAVNQQEANSNSLFVSGWRPSVGWVCSAAFAYHFVIQPCLAFLLAAAGRKVELPAFEMQTLLTVLCGMLGFGGLRTFEKIKGATK